MKIEQHSSKKYIARTLQTVPVQTFNLRIFQYFEHHASMEYELSQTSINKYSYAVEH